MKTIFKIIKGLVLLFAMLLLIYFIGPRVDAPNLDKTLPDVTSNLIELEKQIDEREASISNVRENNEARIVWFDSIPTKTEYSIVYLHGWSASQEEGDPLHIDTAKKFGCNLYLPRLAGHGLDEEEPMLELTADQVIDSAKEAIAVGKQLGEKVILMATSTGGTLALHLAGGDLDIAALLLYSPNVEIFDPNAKLLAKPWGLQLAKLVKGGDYHEFDPKPGQENYWTTKYRLEALTHLQAMIDNTMLPETFKEIDRPMFLGYFYKNDTVQDNVVSVPAMLKMFGQISTEDGKKKKVAFANVNDHVMTSSITSEDLEAVRKETYKFIEEVLGLSKL